MARDPPNIIVTGTPGVGKTSHCELLAQNTGLKHLSINQVVKERDCHDGWDVKFKSWIVDEDKVSCQTNLENAMLITICCSFWIQSKKKSSKVVT